MTKGKMNMILSRYREVKISDMGLSSKANDLSSQLLNFTSISGQAYTHEQTRFLKKEVFIPFGLFSVLLFKT